MENERTFDDDFLRKLIQRIPLDSPSDNFVDRVMENIQPVPESASVKKQFYLYFKAIVPYVVVALFLFFVVATSDIPVLNWLPGKQYFANNLVPYLGNLFTTFKSAFSSKFVSWGLMISFSAGVLFLIDRLFSRRTSL